MSGPAGDVIIVPCVREKIWARRPELGLVPARDAYTAASFQAWRRGAEASGKPWFILSTKFGLLRPDELLEPYDVPLGAALRDQELKAMLARQGRELHLGEFERVILIGLDGFRPLVHAATADLDVVRLFRKRFKS